MKKKRVPSEVTSSHECQLENSLANFHTVRRFHRFILEGIPENYIKIRICGCGSMYMD